MGVKVVIKGQKIKENAEKKIPTIRPPLTKTRDNVIIRMLKIMLMDIRIRLNPDLKKEYDTFCRFSELAWGKR